MITKIWTEGVNTYTNWCSVLPFVGGQVNQVSYDLYSLGPDQRTRVPGEMQVIYDGYITQYGGEAATVNDDIWVDGGNR
ncbi:hypothetical protein HQ590_12565 [bacterium]|nr:hypothetical protein [bacterium]